MKRQYPQRRKENLVVREIHGETLVYDLACDKALCLNGPAAAIWQCCDGGTSPQRMAHLLGVGERVVWCALDQLGKDHLLEAPIGMPAHLEGLTRRQQLRALGKAAAIAVPLVSAVVAPQAADAASLLASGAPCATSAKCISGACISNRCA